MLLYSDGSPFSIGAIACQIRPINVTENIIRIFLSVEIEGLLTEAIIDTGGVYCVLHPSLAELVQFDPQEQVGNARLNIRSRSFNGFLYRATLEIHASEGNDLQQEVTVFVPAATEEEWGDRPTLLGLSGCMEFIRFAIDPLNNQFYFAAS